MGDFNGLIDGSKTAVNSLLNEPAMNHERLTERIDAIIGSMKVKQ
jgi:hypothetical protein